MQKPRLKQSRRDFLKRAGIASLGVPALLTNSFASQLRTCIIVGAGLSGLAAAYFLKRAGWQVIVLEARNRIGGRVLSYSFPQNPNLICELGGEWIGAGHERVRALCHEFNIELQDHRFNPALMRDGVIKRPGEWGFSSQAKSAFEKFQQQYKGYTRTDKLKLDRYDWWTWLQHIGFTEADLQLRDLMDSTDFGESIRHVSALLGSAEYVDASDTNEMDFKIKGGNSRLVKELAVRVGQDNIHTGVQVHEIRQAGG